MLIAVKTSVDTGTLSLLIDTPDSLSRVDTGSDF